MNDSEAASISLGIITEQIRGLNSSIDAFTAQIDYGRQSIEQASEQIVTAETRRDRLIAAGSTLAAAHGITWSPNPVEEPEPTPTPEPEPEPDADSETLASFEADARRQA